MHARPHTFFRIAFLCITPCTIAAAQDAPRIANPAVLMQHAVRELGREAQQARDSGELARKEADFAAAFLRERELAADFVPAHIIWNALRRPQHDRDPFIDAYIRWQLTGFANAAIPPEESLSIEEFESFLANLPAYLLNPRSDRQTVARLNSVLNRQNLSEKEISDLTAISEDLQTREQRVTALNIPAERFRAWIEKQAGARGMRVHQARIERLGSMVGSGWNPERLKREIAAGLEAAAKDYSFTPDQRRRVAGQMLTLAGRRTPIITRITPPQSADDVAQAQFDEAALYDFEVTEWIRIMQGKE